MYITRFTKTDKTAEDHLFHTEEEAKNYLNLFSRDDSGSYRNIAVIDNTMRVTCILPFRNNKPDTLISEGDCVSLREEYSRPEERNDLYVVTNINEWSERINISCITSDMFIKPTETVGVEMVTPACPVCQ